MPPTGLVQDVPILAASARDLVAIAIALGAEKVGELTGDEQQLVEDASGLTPSSMLIRRVRSLIRKGRDPLGEAFSAIRSPEERRPLGQTFTPSAIIRSMVGWAADQGTPVRVVDPGAGSGRYLLSAGRRFPDARLFGAEVDPLATLMLRANLVASGLESRSEVRLGDYRDLQLDSVDGPTLFIGNPPYVRHHLIAPEWKDWLASTARRHGFEASKLAGLHVHFFLATAEYGRAGDFGTFITSSEWLDVNYGSLVRQLVLGKLGGQSLHVISPEATPFADATTTGTITCFKIDTKPKRIKVRQVDSVEELGRLAKGRSLLRERLAESGRWSVLSRVSPKLPADFVELGELCRVHRGAVTGANNIWVIGDTELVLPESVLFPSITRARELFGAGERLASATALRKVVDLPVNLDILDDADRALVDLFLARAKARKVHEGYIASNRKAWWSVGLREPAPILATYMARRPPAFVRNDVQVRHINIAHGLYPREELSSTVLDRLAHYLRSAVSLTQGRTYAGGLVKFEPREMERIPVPTPQVLLQGLTT